MKSLFKFLGLLVLAGCAGQPSQNPSDPSWATKMQKTAHSFQGLFPYIYDENRFNDPRNTKIIKNKIQSFTKDIHNIDKKSAKAILGDDPYILSSISSLRELSGRAYKSFQRGDRSTSRILLKATTNTCFKCHTRQNLGPQNLVWNHFDVHKVNISPVEKAHILVSMRRYEQAKEQLLEFLKDSEINKKFDITYENALHYYLMIVLRGQEGIQPSLKFVRNKIMVADTPTTLHYTLKHWEKDLIYWTKNRKSYQSDLFSAYKALKRNSNTNTDRHFINDLITSQLLHDYLTRESQSKNKAKAYRLLGQVYDELILEGFWDLPEMYYEKCIDYWPKSQLAQNCFQKLKKNVVLGYSGSRGTLIPNQEYSRLERLRKKAGFK